MKSTILTALIAFSSLTVLGQSKEALNVEISNLKAQWVLLPAWWGVNFIVADEAPPQNSTYNTLMYKPIHPCME